MQLEPIIEAILAQYQLNPDYEHGIADWGRVLENGLRLAEVTRTDNILRAFCGRLFDNVAAVRQRGKSRRCGWSDSLCEFITGLPTGKQEEPFQQLEEIYDN